MIGPRREPERIGGVPECGLSTGTTRLLFSCAQAPRRLVGVAVFSGVVNLLTLSGSIYMLQVYDRVIPSRNVATLLGLSAIVPVAYLLQGYFDALRGRMLARIGALFDAELQPQIYFALVSLPLRGTKPILAQQPLRDLDQVRAFLSGAGPTAFLDMPWIPLFLIPLFLFHSAIGAVATCGAAAIVAMTLLTECQARGAAKVSTEGNAQRQLLSDALRENADVIRALGMTGRWAERWSPTNEHYIHHNTCLIRRPCQSRCRGQDPALRPAVGGAWCRRLSGGDGSGVRRHHDRLCDPDGPRAGAGRGCAGELEAVRGGARGVWPFARHPQRYRSAAGAGGRAATALTAA